MNHGGLREGAGRPSGALNKKTLRRQEIKKAIADEVALRFEKLGQDITPLQALLEIGRASLLLGDLDLAQECYSEAMPYVHARKASVPEFDPNGLTAADIAADGDPEMMEAQHPATEA